MGTSREAMLGDLAQRIREIEEGERSRHRSEIALGPSPLRELLPNNQLPAGSLVEFLAAAAGAGAWSLALLVAQRACGEHKALVVADAQRHFYPPAASKFGMDLERCIMVRPLSSRAAAAALQHALRCAAVGAAVGWFEKLSPAECRGLQLAAEAGGGVGLLLRPAAALPAPSFAALRLLVNPVASAEGPRRVEVKVARCRGGQCGRRLVLEIDDETGHVRVPPGVAPPTVGARERRASG